MTFSFLYAIRKISTYDIFSTINSAKSVKYQLMTFFHLYETHKKLNYDFFLYKIRKMSDYDIFLIYEISNISTNAIFFLNEISKMSTYEHFLIWTDETGVEANDADIYLSL